MSFISLADSDFFQIASDIILNLTFVWAPFDDDLPMYKSVTRSFNTLAEYLLQASPLTL